jgi:hypothetical protein
MPARRAEVRLAHEAPQVRVHELDPHSSTPWSPTVNDRQQLNDVLGVVVIRTRWRSSQHHPYTEARGLRVSPLH